MIRVGLACIAIVLLNSTSAVAQDKEKKKEVISFSGSGDGPIKTIDKDGTVEETDASTLNNINVIPGFSGPSYIFEDEDEPARGPARTGQARTRSNTSGARSGGDKKAQAARIDEMLENRKRHQRRDSGNRPPAKRRN